MYGGTKYIYIIKHFYMFWCIKFSFAIPKLVFGSFIGEGGLRIQTYTLNVEVPLARAIMVHGTRSHFAADFLASEYNFQNMSNSCHNLEIVGVDDSQNDEIVGNSNTDGGGVSNAKEYKTVGTLELESHKIHLYEDGTNGWDVQNSYGYDGTCCQILNENNIIVHGIDLRSFGRSESPSIFKAGRVRGLVDDYDNVAKDVITYVRKIREEYGDDLPLYLIGFSVGGSVVSRACEIVGDEKLAEGIIIISPMMKLLTGKINKLIRCIWWFLFIGSKITPLKIIDSGARSERSNPIERVREKDPLCVAMGLPYKTAFEMLKLIRDLHKDSNKIHPDTSVLIFHSLTDYHCFYKGTEKFYNSLGHIKKRRFVTLDNVDHFKAPLRLAIEITSYSSEWIRTGDSNYKLEDLASIRDS